MILDDFLRFEGTNKLIDTIPKDLGNLINKRVEKEKKNNNEHVY